VFLVLIKYINIKREGYRDVASSVCIAGNKVTAPLPFARRPFNTKLYLQHRIIAFQFLKV
jgi:hypothetical protein